MADIDKNRNKAFTRSMSVTKYLLIFSITLLLSFTAKADQGAIVTGSSVNIRQKPTTNSPVIGNVKKDMHLTAIERHTHSVVPRGEPSKWIKILLPVQADVWVKSSYLDQDLQVKAEQLNYRSGPGTNHEALGKIKKGTKVTFLETKDGWTKIKAPEPQYGFIAEKYITLTGKPPVTPEPPQASLSEDKATSQPDIKAEKKEEETKPVSEQKTTSDKNISAADIQVKAPAPVQMGNQTETNKTQITNEQETSPEEVIVTEPEEIAPKAPIDVEPTLNETTVEETSSAETIPVETTAEETSSAEEYPIPHRISPAPVETLSKMLLEENPERIVAREGIVRLNSSPAAPSLYSLYSLHNNKMINFLYIPPESELSLKNYSRKKVTVIGPESIDSRWKNCPLLTVKKIELLNQ